MQNIDLTYLEVLSEDDPDFKAEFIQTFEETFTALVKKMQEELSKNDLPNLSKSAHQLKPSAKMIQLPCAQLLEAIQYDPAKANETVLSDINEQCEQALVQLKNWANIN